jgi:hypothetical protein
MVVRSGASTILAEVRGCSDVTLARLDALVTVLARKRMEKRRIAVRSPSYQVAATKNKNPAEWRGPCEADDHLSPQNLYCIEIPNRLPEVSKLPTR